LERAEALSSSCSLQQQLRQQQVEQERELDYVDSMEYLAYVQHSAVPAAYLADRGGSGLERSRKNRG
jgi:hypothetical protein